MSSVALPHPQEPSLALRRLRFLLWTFRGSPSASLGLALVVGFLLLAAFGPWLVPDPADATGALHLAQRLQPPSALHWFGTDESREYWHSGVSGMVSDVPTEARGTADWGTLKLQ